MLQTPGLETCLRTGYNTYLIAGCASVRLTSCDTYVRHLSNALRLLALHFCLVLCLTLNTMSVLPIAFFGATGGCANACLAHALQHGHYATVLARSPQKLREQLMARSISRDIVEKQLLIIEGDVKDVRAVGRVLQGNGNVNGTGNGKGVEVVISGIGSTRI